MPICIGMHLLKWILVDEFGFESRFFNLFSSGKLFQPGYFSPQPSGDEILKLAPRLGSATISDPQENPTYGSPSNFSSSSKHVTQVQDTTGNNFFLMFPCGLCTSLNTAIA